VSTIGPFELLGWALWVVGFTIEALADHQKTVFRSDPSNAGRFITTGLWARSRHPNYFGEVLLWTGLWVTGFAHYTGGAWLTAASPVLSYLLLTRVSGIPMVEARADAKWGDDPAYIAYRDQTPVLVPRL
jgi:steroid 5-alpha reductase family enzyme